MHLHARLTEWSAGRLDPLLRSVADATIANVVLADPGLRWLYHPYDGGMDVILASAEERDALRERHPTWLSTHPDGM
jgi:hypothetical protein